MFSKRLATEQLTMLSEHSAKSDSGLWIPEYHSLSQIEGFNSHFRTLAAKAEFDGNDVESVLGDQELAWISNEYQICACDTRYWLENYAFINDDGVLVRFDPRHSQSMLLDMWAEREESGSAIEQQVLKARQQGISTVVELAIAHKVNFGIGVKAAVASYDQDACERMGGMMELAFNEMPSWMKANPTSDRAGSLKAFAATNTRLTLYSGKKAAGIARGDTPSVLHISEVSIFPDASNVIEKSLFQAVHPSPNTFMILESTGNGNTDWWARTWYSSRDYWASGGARLQPVFFPWFIAIDIFPTPVWRKDHPVPQGWQPLPETQRMMAKAAQYVHQTPLIRKYAGDDWRMQDFQAYYWEQMLLEARRKGEENSWYQEMPMDDCVTGDTRVSTEQGIIRIDQAASAKSTESGAIEAWTPKGQREIFEVITKDGRIIKATDNHRILTGEGWKYVRDLNPGDELQLSNLRFASSHHIHVWSDTKLFKSLRVVDEKMGRFLGYFMGDGSFHSTSVEVACDAKDEDVVQDVKELLSELSDYPARIQEIGKMKRVRSSSVYWRPLLESMGCLKPTMHVEKRICGVRRKVCVPEVIFRSPRSVVKEFLSALFECDGHATKGTPRVSLFSMHDQFLRDVQILLLGFGIRSRLDKIQKKNGNGRVYTGRDLSIPAPFADRFYEEIGFISKRKQSTGMRRLGRNGHSPYDGYVDSVKEVAATGEMEYVYDLTIAETHQFAANGVIVHNCEALRPKKDLVFDIIEVQKQEENREPYTCWAIIGEQVQERYHPMEEEIDREQEPFRVSYDGNITDLRGRIAETFWWEFVPLKQPKESGIDLFDAERKCMIFRWPEEGYTYGIGVDNSGGTGRDGSYISVNGKSIYGNEPDFQAACFWTNRVDPSLMHPYIMALVSLYKTEMPEGNEPVVGIEQVFGLGDTPQIQMLSMGFNKRNLYHFSRLDGKNPEADKKKSHRMGWYTTEWSRNFMLSTYKTAVENHWRRVNDPFLLKQEIPSFQIDKTDGGKTRWDHQEGKRDDRIFGDGISFIILNDTESFARRIQTKFEGEDEELVIDYGYPVGINSTMEQMMGADL